MQRLVTVYCLTSHHLAISLTLEVQPKCTASPKGQDIVHKFLWEKANHDLYRSVLSGLLSQLVIPTEALSCCSAGCNKHTHYLEVYYLGLINCLQEAANKVA